MTTSNARWGSDYFGNHVLTPAILRIRALTGAWPTAVAACDGTWFDMPRTWSVIEWPPMPAVFTLGDALEPMPMARQRVVVLERWVGDTLWHWAFTSAPYAEWFTEDQLRRTPRRERPTR